MEEPKALLPNGHSDSLSDDKPQQMEVDEVEPKMKDDVKTEPKRTKSTDAPASDEASDSTAKIKTNESEETIEESSENTEKQIEKSASKKKVPQKIVKRSPRISRNKDPPGKDDSETRRSKSEDKEVERKSDDKLSKMASTEEEKGSKEAGEVKKEEKTEEVAAVSEESKAETGTIKEVEKKDKGDNKTSGGEIRFTGDPEADFLGFDDLAESNYSSRRDSLKKMLDELITSMPGHSRSRRSVTKRDKAKDEAKARDDDKAEPSKASATESVAVKKEAELESEAWFDRKMQESQPSQLSYYDGSGDGGDDDIDHEGSGVSNAMLIPEVVYMTGDGGSGPRSSAKDDSRSRRSRPSLVGQTDRKPSPVIKRNYDVTLPQYLKPFEYGWKRELAYRNNTDTISKRNADVFYYTPLGKKIRSIGQVRDYLLGTDLTLENFTFVTKSMNLGDPNKETIRDPRKKVVEKVAAVVVDTSPLTTRKSSAASKTQKPANSVESTAADKAEEKSSTSPPKAAASPIPTPKISLKSFRPPPKTKVADKKAKKVSDESENEKEELEMGMLPPLWKSPIRSSDWSANGSTTMDISSATKSEKGSKRQLEPAESEPPTSPPAKRAKKDTGDVEPIPADPAPPATPAPDAPKTAEPAPAPPDVSVPSVVSVPQPPPSSSVSVNKDFFMTNVSAIYHALLNSFQYLKVQELLRAARVCHMWRDVAMNRSLWHIVRMKNSRVRDWDGLANTLRNTGARHLDMRKMLMPDKSEDVTEMWSRYAQAIDRVNSLWRIDLCRCPASAIERSARANARLQYLSALAIKSSSLDSSAFENCKNLTELRLKSSEKNGLDLENLSSLKHLAKMKHLSLTTMKSFSGGLAEALENMKDLETLELGECSELTESVAKKALPKLKRLQRLRLEKGQGPDCPTIAILESVKDLKNLVQLELINFDIKSGFDTTISKCTNLRTLLIIPTYVTQSATTNHLVMEGVSKLSKTLTLFVWGITLELLRVTDLFIDQWEGQKGAIKSPSNSQKKGSGDSIPILKPLAEAGNKEGGAPSQVDILQLPKLHKVLTSLLPTTKVKILKVPFSATWRQTVSGPAHIH